MQVGLQCRPPRWSGIPKDHHPWREALLPGSSVLCSLQRLLQVPGEVSVSAGHPWGPLSVKCSGEAPREDVSKEHSLVSPEPGGPLLWCGFMYAHRTLIPVSAPQALSELAPRLDLDTQGRPSSAPEAQGAAAGLTIALVPWWTNSQETIPRLKELWSHRVWRWATFSREAGFFFFFFLRGKILSCWWA